MRVGRAVIQILETPGHSADHCCYRVETGGSSLLIAGDAIFEGGKIVLQDIPDCSVAATLDLAIRRLAGLEFQSFLPGHGGFSLHDGMRHVARAALSTRIAVSCRHRCYEWKGWAMRISRIAWSW